MISQAYKNNEASYRFPDIFRPIRSFFNRTIDRYHQRKRRRQHLDLLLTMEERTRNDIGLHLTDTDRFRKAHTFRVIFQPELNTIKSDLTRTPNEY